MTFRNYFYFFLIVLLCFSCSKKDIEKSTIQEVNLEAQMIEAYKEGLKELEAGDVIYAAKKFNEAEILFPQSEYAPKSALMAAYSYYTQNYYGDAMAELIRFIRVYPNHKDVVYAEYLLGLCYYEQIVNEKKDLQSILNAKKTFNSLISKYPDSEFARDAIKKKISSTTQDITGKASNLASGMVNDTFSKLGPLANAGMGGLYSSVNSKITAATGNPGIGHLAGVASQISMAAPLQVAENLVGCLANNIVADLGSNIEDILSSVVDNAVNFVDCVADQTVGAITNSVIGKVGDGMDQALGGLDKVMSFVGGGAGIGGKGFVENLVRNSTSSIAGAVGLKGCNEPVKKSVGSCRYVLGYGPVSGGDADLSKIIKNANLAASLSTAAKLTGFPLEGIQDIAGALDIFNSEMKVPGFKSAISDCYSGLPTVCEPPKIKLFGGGGSGAEAIPIFGNIIGDNRYRTGSVIDIKVTNPGNNYQFPPFVEVVDNCKQGLGATARATIKDGKIDNIYIVSEGENYPVGDQPEIIVTSVTIINPGSGYSDGDTVTDNIGNQYDVTIQNGSIIKVKPLTQIKGEDLPVFDTTGGNGALLLANIDERPDYQGEVKEVIDCVS
mgnify:CR=1 FL=1